MLFGQTGVCSLATSDVILSCHDLLLLDIFHIEELNCEQDVFFVLGLLQLLLNSQALMKFLFMRGLDFNSLELMHYAIRQTRIP